MIFNVQISEHRHENGAVAMVIGSKTDGRNWRPGQCGCAHSSSMSLATVTPFTALQKGGTYGDLEMLSPFI